MWGSEEKVMEIRRSVLGSDPRRAELACVWPGSTGCISIGAGIGLENPETYLDRPSVPIATSLNARGRLENSDSC